MIIKEKYYVFLKNYLSIADSEINYIIELKLENNNITNEINNDIFKKLLMKKYINNYNILIKYINIKKRNFN